MNSDIPGSITYFLNFQFYPQNVAARDLRWAVQLLHRKVAAHGDEAVRRAVAEWEAVNDADEISSFPSLCALVWRSMTRARAWLPANATTTFRMAVNCWCRVTPKVSTNYFGNAIQSIPTTASVGDVAVRDLRWAAQLLHRNVAAHGDEAMRRAVAEWEAAPRCFPLGNSDGAGITMGSSHRFPMYEGNDFGWGLPAAVRSGQANKFDGKMLAFPGRDLGGSVELEMCLAPETMAAQVQVRLPKLQVEKFVQGGGLVEYVSKYV
ncbi:hypothetical protein Cni_G08684 [Canna indica]|uniref:BAHD acyltransferase DCR n=1 Tax=Canna indica TaxID=4628 RepID=A0AAQ3K169_9LILI|nr:hypothetical protein Cni_G08684 [Canna indica]